MEYLTNDIADLAAYVNIENLDELEEDSSPYTDNVNLGNTSLDGTQHSYHNASQARPKSNLFGIEEEQTVKPSLKDSVLGLKSSIQVETIKEKTIKSKFEKDQDQGETEKEDDHEKHRETEKENIKVEQKADVKESEPVKESELDEGKKSPRQSKGDKEIGGTYC